MDWGIDPERVSEIADIIRNRRFAAADAEKFMLAIVGGAGEHADSALWDMTQVLLGLGTLLAQPRMPPRDAAIACLLDESGMLLASLRSGKRDDTSAGLKIWTDKEGLSLESGAATRTYGWSRIKRCLGLADFLFMSGPVDPAVGSGTDALRNALDTLFSEDGDLVLLSKRAVQAPARYMRSWRKRYLPLQAFADLIRHREAFLAAGNRRGVERHLSPDDILDFWQFAVDRGETWSFGRFAEKLAALLREERSDTDRRAFLAPVALDAMVVGEPSTNPEVAIIEWLDRDDAAETEAHDSDPVDRDDGADSDTTPEFTERTLSALLALPQDLKVLTKEERRQAAHAFALVPMSYEQPLTLLRSFAVTPWENRLVEASRRGLRDDKGGNFSYCVHVEDIVRLDRQFSDLIMIALHLETPDAPGATTLEATKLLKKWRHDRASFRVEDAKLSQTFTMMRHDLRIVAASLKRILQQMGRLRQDVDLNDQSARDEARFAAAFLKRYSEQAKKDDQPV